MVLWPFLLFKLKWLFISGDLVPVPSIYYLGNEKSGHIVWMYDTIYQLDSSEFAI